MTNFIFAFWFVIAKPLTGDQDAVTRLDRFLRLAVVWSILMIGAALTLAAAVIQLALAYQ